MILKLYKWFNGVWKAILGKKEYYTDIDVPYSNPQYDEAK